MSHDPPEWVRDGASGFQSPYPAAVSQVGVRTWKLVESPMRYWDAELGIVIEVPIHQETDWASVGWMRGWLDQMTGTAATLLHDYLWRVLVPAGEMSYRDADRILRQALRSLRDPNGDDPDKPVVSGFDAWVMWAGVRLGALTRGREGRRGWLWTAPGVLAIMVPLGLYLLIPSLFRAPFLAGVWLARWWTR